jgi:hypothetical protein
VVVRAHPSSSLASCNCRSSESGRSRQVAGRQQEREREAHSQREPDDPVVVQRVQQPRRVGRGQLSARSIYGLNDVGDRGQGEMVMRARAPSGDPVTSDISRSPQVPCPPAKPQLTASRHDFADVLQGRLSAEISRAI